MNATGRLQLLLFGLLTIFLYSCGKDKDQVAPGSDVAYQEEVIGYFKEVALGFEFGTATPITRKWKGEMMVFVGGSKNALLLTELKAIISEVNALASDGFHIQLTEDSLQSNYYVFFGSGTDYAALYPSQSGYISSNWGLFTVYFTGDNVLYRGNMYVDVQRASPGEQKHLLREEFTQSLGLAKDSPRYPDSIFQQSWTSTTSYAQIDKDLIRLLYHPRMQTGLNASQADPVLRSIFPLLQ
jgi:hypothetical protein